MNKDFRRGYVTPLEDELLRGMGLDGKVSNILSGEDYLITTIDFDSGEVFCELLEDNK